MTKPKRKKRGYFNVVIERDQARYYVASVPELYGCHTQAKSLDSLIQRVREAIALWHEVRQEVELGDEFIGVQRISI